jgi:hypothetical protein
MIRLALLLAGAVSLAHAATVFTIVVDGTTTFLDSSMLTAGTTYYSAFELTGGDASNSTALITGIDFGGGSAVALDLSDTFGTFMVGPDGSDPDGAFQNAGTLQLDVTPGNSFSQYAQQFVAGTRFSFTVALDGIYAGGIPDEFSFQLYDNTLSTELYEQDLDILTTSTVPEPATVVLCLLAIPILAAGARRRSGDHSARQAS